MHIYNNVHEDKGKYDTGHMYIHFIKCNKTNNKLNDSCFYNADKNKLC